MSFLTEIIDDSKDKFYNSFFEINELSYFIDQNEHLFSGPIDYSSKEEINEKKEIQKNEDVCEEFRIPDKPFQSQENITQLFKVPITENDNYYSINFSISDKSILSNDKMNENEINSFLSNETNRLNENINKTKSIKSLIDTTNKTKTINENNKYNFNNILRKIKHLILYSLINFINSKIKEFYNDKIGKGIFKKELQTLNQKEKSESNIKFNQEFLNRTIKDIFSNDISGRYTNISKDHNKKIIENLLNEENFDIKYYFTNLFNLTFKQCLEHYRGTKSYFELNGMKLFEEEINNNFMDDEYYIKALKYHLDNYEKILNNKKSRKSKKNNTIES